MADKVGMADIVKVGMKKHEDWRFREVSDEARKLFEESREKGASSVNLFIEGVSKAMDDLDKEWLKRSSNEIGRRFDKVFKVARELMLCRDSGGSCDNGLHSSTFLTYQTIAKKVLVYHVRWQTAKTHKVGTLSCARKVMVNNIGPDDFDWLGKARKLYEKEIEGKEDTYDIADKMDVGIDCVQRAFKGTNTTTRSVEDEEQAKEQAKEERKKKKTPWTLPDPDHCDPRDDAIQQLFSIVLQYLNQPALQSIVNADTDEGRASRMIIGDIQNYRSQKAAKEAEAA